MTTPDTSTRSVIIEKEFPHSPEKVWRALTDSSLIEQWLMKNDFLPVTAHSFNLRMDPMPNWNGVIDCRVLALEPYKSLAYSWDTPGLETVVTWTLSPTAGGTHVRMEHSGFRPDQDANYTGAQWGWQKFIAGLDGVLGRLP